MSGLHAANVLQTSDLIRSAEAGLCIGGAAGAVLGALMAACLALHPQAHLEGIEPNIPAFP